MKTIRFAFADGHVLLVKPTDPVRLRHHAVYGVETCPAEKLLTGTYPDGGPAVDWRHVEGTGREHTMEGCRIEAGEVGPAPVVVEVAVPEVAAAAPAVEVEVEAPAPKTKRKAKTT